MNNAELAAWIRELIRTDQLYRFYKGNEWIALRAEVMREDHYECQHCLERGIYTRAEMVHHVNEVRKRPDMALTKEYIDPITKEKKRKLVSLCNPCHELEHDRFENYRSKYGVERFTNEERW